MKFTHPSCIAMENFLNKWEDDMKESKLKYKESIKRTRGHAAYSFDGLPTIIRPRKDQYKTKKEYLKLYYEMNKSRIRMIQNINKRDKKSEYKDNKHSSNQ